MRLFSTPSPQFYIPGQSEVLLCQFVWTPRTKHPRPDLLYIFYPDIPVSPQTTATNREHCPYLSYLSNHKHSLEHGDSYV